MAAFKQENRPLRIQTPFGEDVLLIKSLTGTERLGRPFKYDLVLVSTEQNLDFKKILGQNVTIFLDKSDKEPRWFNGFVSRFAQTTFEGRLVEYRATLVPWLWFLTRSSDCRVFQSMTIPEIVKQVFQDHGFTDVVERIYGSYRQWDYCVQYRETAFDFVSRLMEEEGIYYFFKHESDKHSLVMCDSPGSHKEFKGYEELSYHPTSTAGVETLDRWHIRHEVQTGVYTTSNYDFTTPRKNTLANSVEDRDYSQSNLEQYDYLGEQSPFSEGERYSKLRLEEQQAQYEVYSGEGDARGICTGVRFTLKGHPRNDFNQDYLITGADYHIEAGSFESGAAEDEGFKFHVKLTAIALTQQFRPARITPKPIAHGPQTAVVVGPSGQPIYTDQYGRVKVQFHWDRLGTSDQNSSCWIRVSQKWASNGWGDIAIPHVGDEVIVECLEGDPDRPLITGCLYNEANTPPLDLPTNKYKRIWQDDYGNRMVFDGTSGDEHIRLHSPGSKSGITLGRSACQFTQSNTNTATMGDVSTVAIGGTVNTYIGGYAELVGGVYAQVILGGDYEATLGTSFELKLANAFEISAGYTHESHNSDFFKVCDGNVVISSDKILNLIGGAGHTEGTSIIHAQPNFMEFSVGDPLPPSPAPSTLWKVGRAAAKIAVVSSALLLPLAAAATAAAGSYYAGEAVNDFDSDDASQASIAAAQDGLEMAAISCEVAGLIASLLCGIVMNKLATTTSPAKHNQSAMDGRLIFNATDSAKCLTVLESGGSVMLFGGSTRQSGLILDGTQSKLACDNPSGKTIVAAGASSGMRVTPAQITISCDVVAVKAASFSVAGSALSVEGSGTVPAPTNTLEVETTTVTAADAALETQFAAQKAAVVTLNAAKTVPPATPAP